ncbi:ATP-binding protein [Streptomyces sp. NA04227]|uniref:ATP-binding protein n=1 Tax=Streptomyces sp. NA04227 TaxID=2742136 RepID=UPI0020CA9621|nr:ATP-binding protein [Streptomyces sp. NA04227]
MYSPQAGSVGLARRRTKRLVGEWGCPELADDAALLVSELATNALLHGCLRDRLFQVRLTMTAELLRIEVSDPRGERMPQPRDAEQEESTGRGLLIVRSLAARWGTTPRTVGKTVFAELDMTSPQQCAARSTALPEAAPGTTREVPANRPV